jgi:acetyl-CoA carboxylase biotin carboxylase subunit
VSLARVLIANRGEIALRVIKACRALGVEAVVAASEADLESLPAKTADTAVCIGPAPAAESYLNVEAIIRAARDAGADAVHPGYGFLAESPDLAQACVDAGIVFIGPDARTIQAMGNKLQARAFAREHGVPVLPGSETVRTAEEGAAAARTLGYPLLIKAAAGGGGRGIKIVRDAGGLGEAITTAGAEARAAFADETLYVERYIADARHVEVQVMGDAAGNVVHVGERDCSLQRRYQKVVEEAPAWAIQPEVRDEMRAAAVTLAREIGYVNAGTVEFLADQADGRFYFLEMNTRIQVEHPVSEMITGIDLVREQLLVAGGAALGFAQSDVAFTGHAIECRITAEAPGADFQPRPGRIDHWHAPEGPHIRVDSHCHPGADVPPYYDSLLAKLIVGGRDRVRAVAAMQQALAAFEVEGVETTIPFLGALARRLEFVQGRVNTSWLEDNLGDLVN